MEAKEKFIRDRQSDFPQIKQMQDWIDKGYAWSMEGAVGREAMRGLRSGMYFLPDESYKDYYGNHIASREQVKEGTTGSLSNSYDFYQDDDNLWELELQYEDDENH